MIITAKFNGRCAKCGLPTEKGTEIDYLDKRAYHRVCLEQEEAQGPSAEQIELAERLGYRMHAEWANLLICTSAPTSSTAVISAIISD